MSVDTNLIKKPYQREKFTNTELEELVKCTQDPKHFLLEHCFIQHPTRGRMKFDLYDFLTITLSFYKENFYKAINILLLRVIFVKDEEAGAPGHTGVHIEGYVLVVRV